MKTTIFFLVIIVIAFQAFGQEQTLLSGKIEHGGYGGPVVKFTSINNKFGVLVGGHGGWIINHSLVIGGGGYGLVNDVDANSLGPLGEKYVEFGYGGFEIEWIINSDKLIHFSIHTLIGGGGVTFRNEGEDITHHNKNGDNFFVLEPGATLDLNVTPWLRFSVGAGYRFVSGVDSPVSTNEDLSAPAAVVMLRFGKF
jgi:hypothetical protein